ncbi:hypothetical protein AVL50_16700 [Flammeovirga sp. SJP92]|nr:hypothetical protein AVL50_16700 [Flammeovirga sp. SJP92]
MKRELIKSLIITVLIIVIILIGDIFQVPFLSDFFFYLVILPSAYSFSEGPLIGTIIYLEPFILWGIIFLYSIFSTKLNIQ